MRPIACLPLGLLGLVVAGSHCGGIAFTPDFVDASRDGVASSSSGGTGSGGGSSSGSSSSGSGSSGSGSGSGGSSGSGSGGSSSSSGSSSGSGSGGSSSSSGSSSGSGSGGSSSSSGSSSGSGSGGSSSGGGGCSPSCGSARHCCGNTCVNPANDPNNCGGCNIKCGPGTYCNGSCQPIPCASGVGCKTGDTCCGSSCCTAGQLCCEQQGPVGTPYPTCFTPTASQPTCPQGCAPLCVSDRNLKHDIEPIDDQAVLETVARMPISTWSYKSDDPSVRHLGPMAQDFYAAFGLGDTDRAYNPIDAHGVTLAAIKALYERVQKQQVLIERLERENQAAHFKSSDRK